MKAGVKSYDLVAAGTVLVLEQRVDIDGADADQLHLDLLASAGP